MSARKNKSDDGNISRICRTANLMQNLRQGTADGWRKRDGGAQSHAHGWVLAHAATACRAANTPPSTCRMNAANGMRRYTRIPATSRHAALMKSDIRILTGLSHSISGFGKNSILTSLVEALGVIYKIAVCLFTFIVLLLPTSFSCVITVFEIDTGT